MVDNLIATGKVQKSPSERKYSYKIPNNSTTTYQLDSSMIRDYLNRIYYVKASWEGASVKDTLTYTKMMDSYKRQIDFCNTLLQRLSQRSATRDDYVMWESVLKMSRETALWSIKLNLGR